MKKIINKKNNKNEPWFKWLTRELNSYEAFPMPRAPIIKIGDDGKS